MRNKDRNTSTKNRRGRHVGDTGEAAERSEPVDVAMSEPRGNTIIVRGPCHTNEKGEGNGACDVKARIDRSDPNRLLVTFCNLAFKGKENTRERQGAQQGDEGKDLYSMDAGQEVLEEMALDTPAESVETHSVYDETL